MQKVIEDMNFFRKISGLEKKLVMKYKQVFPLLNMSFKLPFKIIYIVKNRGKIIVVEWEWTKYNAHYESYGKTDQKN